MMAIENRALSFVRFLRGPTVARWPLAGLARAFCLILLTAAAIPGAAQAAQDEFFAHCQNAQAHTRTGGTIYVGAPTGSTALLSRKLTGGVPDFNQCRSPK